MGLWHRPYGQHPYTKWWLLWGAMFLAIETTAVANRRQTPGGTLSSLVWRTLDPKHPIRRRALIVFILGLTVHFLFRWI